MSFYKIFSKQFWTNKNTEKIVEVFDRAEQKTQVEAGSNIDITKQSLEELFSAYGTSAFQVYSSIVYSQLSQRKTERHKIYLSMSAHPDISDAIDEIADTFYNIDTNNRFINLIIKNDELSTVQKNVLQSEFDKFINYFNFDENLYSYVRNFMTYGELFFENVIDPKHPSKGILGVKQLEASGFEFLKLPGTFQNVGFIYYPSYGQLNHNNQGSSFGTMPLPAQFLHAANKSMSNMKDAIAVPNSQITYINTNNYDASKSIVYPPLEKCRKLFNQVIMLEDAAIVYRIARSPQRLVFNVNTGNMPRHRAEQEVFKLMRRFQTRKAPVGGSGEVDGAITNVYDNHNALESYFFIKSGDGGGTEVEHLDSPVGFDQMEDVKYFTKKLYNALKIPYARVEEADREEVTRKNEVVGFAEYRFARFVMRLQMNFAAGLLRSFKTHLVLLKIWDKYNLKPFDLQVKISPPTEYELYNRLKLQQTLYDVYSAYAGNEEFSKTYLQKKILNWSDAEIDEHAIHRAIDAILLKKQEFIESKVSETGWLPKIEEIPYVDTEDKLKLFNSLFIQALPSRLNKEINISKNETFKFFPPSKSNEDELEKTADDSGEEPPDDEEPVGGGEDEPIEDEPTDEPETPEPT